MGIRDLLQPRRVTKARPLPAVRNETPIDLKALTIGAGNTGPQGIPDEAAASLRDQGMDPSRSFSPGAPIAPYEPLGEQPRARNFRSGHNITARPRSEPGRVSFDTLRGIIGAYDVARVCIEHICDDVRSLDWQIIAAEGVNDDVTSEIDQAKAFLRKPDGVTPFDTWLTKFLDDIVSYDAGCLYRRRNRKGDVIGLEVVDGTMIAPVIDYYGRQPVAPAPAYVQFANGVPWGWFTADELIYNPFRPQSGSVYGLPSMEYLLLNANTDIRFQWYFLQTFTEGTLPDTFMEAPPDMSSPDQIIAFQEAWDAVMEGDQAQLHKVRWVPSGSKPTPTRDIKYDFEFPLYLMRKTAAAFKVTPNDLGFTDDVNRATSETQVDVQFRVGTKPRVMHVKGIIDRVLQDDKGWPVQWAPDLGQEKEDRLTEAQSHAVYVNMGAESPDEVREKVLGLPIDAGRPVPRFIMTSRGGPVPLTALYGVASDIDPETAGPTDAAPMPTAPFQPIDGVLPQAAPPPGAIVAPAAPDEAAPEEISTGVAKQTVSVAGLCVRADDTGRVLMLQRSFADDSDPAAGTWEFPGGHIEPGEAPLAAAKREWCEETGCMLPTGDVVDSWTSPNGVYRGFVYVVATEDDVHINLGGDRHVLNPDDPDGDDIEVAAWFAPEHLPAMPALREEVRSSDWDAITGVTVLKEATAGMTSATGLTGTDALDDDEDEELDPEEVEKELRRWRDNARSRVRKGQTPRWFISEVIPDDVAARVWAQLSNARTVEAVLEAFEVAKSRPKGGPRLALGHELADRIVAHYGPKLAKVFVKMFDPGRIARESHALRLQVAKAANPEDVSAARTWLGEITNLDPGEAAALLEQLYTEGYLTGAHAAGLHLLQGGAGSGSGGGGGGTITGGPGGLAGGIDWGSWEPGNPMAADQVLAVDGTNGLAELLERAGVTITSVSDTYLDDLANALALGLENGDSVDTIAGDLADILEDPSHADMVAVTETARAQTAASMDTYLANDVPLLEWLEEDDACEDCMENGDASPIAIDDEWPNGDVPVHPNCRCALAPAYPDTSEEGDTEEPPPEGDEG